MAKALTEELKTKLQLEEILKQKVEQRSKENAKEAEQLKTTVEELRTQATIEASKGVQEETDSFCSNCS